MGPTTTIDLVDPFQGCPHCFGIKKEEVWSPGLVVADRRKFGSPLTSTGASVASVCNNLRDRDS